MSLLSLYRAALTSAETYRAAWPAVETARAAGTARSILSGGTDETDDEDRRLVAAYYVAMRDLETANDALCAAIAGAEWGAQADGTFITITSTTVASGRYARVLHAPAKGGPLAVVTDRERWNTGCYLASLNTPAKAREIREAERARNREAGAAYLSRRAQVIGAIRRGLRPAYTPGQQGGYFAAPDGSCVSAPGVARALGCTLEDLLGALDGAPERLAALL